MLLLNEATLMECATANLARLAKALGVPQDCVGLSEKQARAALIRAILKAERHLSTQPRQVPAGAQPKPRGRNKRRAYR